MIFWLKSWMVFFASWQIRTTTRKLRTKIVIYTKNICRYKTPSASKWSVVTSKRRRKLKVAILLPCIIFFQKLPYTFLSYYRLNSIGIWFSNLRLLTSYFSRYPFSFPFIIVFLRHYFVCTHLTFDMMAWVKDSRRKIW